MKLVSIYECLCDATRLRLLNLLLQGPLCVCHLQAVLGESQVKISKHLSYLRARGYTATAAAFSEEVTGQDLGLEEEKGRVGGVGLHGLEQLHLLHRVCEGVRFSFTSMPPWP
jgi:DNA-binding transcriptional ArsR family regulator